MNRPNRRLARASLPFRMSGSMRFLLASAIVIISVGCSLGQSSTAPAWVKEAIFYHVFPERFCNGDLKNDPTRESLELPVSPEPAWRIPRWTADWYSRDDWE